MYTVARTRSKNCVRCAQKATSSGRLLKKVFFQSVVCSEIFFKSWLKIDAQNTHTPLHTPLSNHKILHYAYKRLPHSTTIQCSWCAVMFSDRNFISVSHAIACIFAQKISDVRSRKIRSKNLSVACNRTH